MKANSIPDDYVRIAKCRMCGGKTNSILMSTRLRSIKESQSYDSDPCDECKTRLKTMVYFMGECGHSGFVKEHVIQNLVKPTELRDAVLSKRVCRMEKCFACLQGQGIKDFEHI